MTSPFRSPRCDALITIHETVFPSERRCELAPNHSGFHSSRMDGCEPRAELTWWTADLHGDFVKRDGSHSPTYVPDDEGSGGVW